MKTLEKKKMSTLQFNNPDSLLHNLQDKNIRL